ncbi:hypothetical protein [Chryseobacterium echinoideorum]|uniref:hypothetical protein n=1 Tax=Chryseobacterium echinoideorum TaxID=1549648 RepID=UPI0011858510|nr:hypothetical protein [Chryseobacterium echinoideorum]
MAVAKCSISFDVNYTSSSPVTSAIASYKISSAGSYTDFPIPLPTVPYVGSNLSVSLPEIQTYGDYHLVVTLNTQDGAVARKESSFKIGNCPGRNPPTVSLKWNDGELNADRSCTQSACSYTIDVNATDPDNDITNIRIQKSTDGSTWNTFTDNLTIGNFTDSINTEGKNYYRAVVIDAKNHSVISNTLSYTKEKAEVPVCDHLSNTKDARLDIIELSNSPDWVIATVDVAQSAVGKQMNMSHEIYYRRCNDIFKNNVEVVGTDNKIIQTFEIPNDLPSGVTGHQSLPIVYTPNQAGQIMLRISEYSSFTTNEKTPAHLHVESQLLFLDKEIECSRISAEHNFSIYRGTDCTEPEFKYTEIARDEPSDQCKQSKLSFMLEGDRSDVPMTFYLDGNPSGAVASIYIEGDGGIVKQSNLAPLNMVRQTPDGDPQRTEIPVFVTVKGKINVDIILDASQSVRVNGDISLAACDTSGGKTPFIQNALAEMRSTSMSIYLNNTKTVYI